VISKQDILDRAAEWQLRPDVVEKDYVLGWLLAGLGAHEETRTRWIFKGGTCIKKCYFETYRFSEDLDFSLLPEARYTEDDIRAAVDAATRLASESSGIAFPRDLVEVRTRRNKQGEMTFQVRVSYRGPLAFPILPRVLLDLTRHEPVLDTPTARGPFHPYPDALPDGGVVLTYSFHELLAEKMRALYERIRPRDLYDVIYLLENRADALDFRLLHELFRKKCAVKELEIPTVRSVVGTVLAADELRSEWANMLAHQLPQLPALDDLLSRLPELIAWVDSAAVSVVESALRPVPVAPETSAVIAAGIQYWGGVPLEAVRFAGANRLLVGFTYDGTPRLVEPYSLRRAGTGNLLLYGWEQGSTHIKAFNVAKMGSVRPTQTSFQPRYRIEFVEARPLSAPQTTTAIGGFYAPPRSPRRTRSAYGSTYTFQCPYCDKPFRRTTNDPKLRKHKTKDGWDCSGRHGYLQSLD
jgi:predicted nucleotidyltransferase component of viral defense system